MEINIYKNWWLLTIKGLLVTLFGIAALFFPGVTLASLMIYFGILILASGAFLLIGAFSHVKDNKHWANWLFEGLLDIIIGVVIIIYPKLTIDLFIIIVGIWAITVGFTQLFSALKAHKTGQARWLMLLNAIIVVVFGIVLFINPTESSAALTMLVGIFAIIFGVIVTIYSFNLRNLKG
ncbi:HdeD family acid-resistance protein [Bacteroidota bacterium]